MLIAMTTAEANQPDRRFHRADARLIDMLEGALFPLRPPPPPRPEHDFLVVNLHEDLSGGTTENFP